MSVNSSSYVFSKLWALLTKTLRDSIYWITLTVGETTNESFS